MTTDPSILLGYRSTALWYAIEGGITEVCQLLLAKGADVNHIDDEGHPLLWKAFAKDDVATARLLLAKGAAVHSPNVDYGDETLLFALLQGMLFLSWGVCVVCVGGLT
jgi:ankyrin repeat protein